VDLRPVTKGALQKSSKERFSGFFDIVYLVEGVTKGVTRYAGLLEFWEIFAGAGFAGSRRFIPVQRELFRQ
jgi:hypothetical protein